MDYPSGLDPFIARQNLLHHTYSPLISVHSSHNADALIQSILDINLSVLEVLKPYGNNATFTVPNQSFKIVNNQLITRNYPSFPIRFQPSLPELLSVLNAGESTKTISQLFSISSLEHLTGHLSKSTSGQNLYLSYFNKIVTSRNIVPFDTFNHPISQIFIIDFAVDTIESLRKSIVEFRNYNFPKYFQIEDLLIHIFVLYNPAQTDQVLLFQQDIKNNLNTHSTLIPVDVDGLEKIQVSLMENSTISEDLQRLSLKRTSGDSDHIMVPKLLDSTIRFKLYEYINKYLIPHMQSKIRVWDDLILQPKKSIAGRFFLVSKKFFNNDAPTPTIGATSYNQVENYYYKSSPEQTIRKLADWSLILKDFKYAYSTYDLIKKDYTNDKAWAYVALTQEMCIVSLLLAQTQQNSSVAQPNMPTLAQIPDKNTLRKIRHDIIEPYIDNLSYTFKSRLNLKTYSIKALTIVVELLLCICKYYDLSWRWNDLIEKYLIKLVNEFDQHLHQTGSIVINALLYERLGYSSGKCVFLAEVPQPREAEEEPEEGYFVNTRKLQAPADGGVVGLTRYRKSSIWYLLSIKEWLDVKQYDHIQYLLKNISKVYDIEVIGENWYDRNDLLLGFVTRALGEVADREDKDPQEKQIPETNQEAHETNQETLETIS